MKNKTLLTLGLTVGLIGIFVLVFSKNETDNSYVFIWPKQNTDPCSIVAFNVDTHQEIAYQSQSCNYQILQAGDNKFSLIHIGYESDEAILNLLNLTNNRIENRSQLILPITSVTSDLRWLDEDTAVFSGIHNSTYDESIFFINMETGVVEQRLAPTTGFYTAPNPDQLGKRISYLYWKNDFNNSLSCQLKCNVYTYQIRNIEENTVLDIQELSQEYHDPIYSQCDGEWNPEGRYFAYRVGCRDSEGILVFDVSAENIIFNNSGIADILMWVDETKLLYYVYDYDQNAYEYYIYDLEIGQATKQNFLSMHQVFEDYQVTWFTIDWHDQLAIGYSVRPENGGTKDLSELVESPKVSTILIGHWANAHLFSVAIKGQIVESPIWLKDRNMGVVVVNETIDSEDIPKLKIITFDTEGNILGQGVIKHNFLSSQLHINFRFR